MKTIYRDISFNNAGMILELMGYKISNVKHLSRYNWDVFYNSAGEIVARYHEPSGRLQIRIR